MSAPDEATAMAALQKIQSLDNDAFDKRMMDELGPNMLGIFSALARSLEPEADKNTIAKRVHLMVLSFFLSRELN